LKALPSTQEFTVKVCNKWLAALGLCAGASILPAFAADVGDVVVPATASNDRPAATDPTIAPLPQKYNHISVVNGGADSDEAIAIKRIAPQYKLRVEISGRGGAYQVADDLKLMQRGEVIAEIPDAGPWLLFDVPAGSYTLVGQFAEQRIQRDVTVAASGATVHWVLPPTVN
jgi:hypothetical protein